jgi:hypothetical protein
MQLHINGSRQQWFQDERWYDLIVIWTSPAARFNYAQLEESTMTVTAGLCEAIQQKGVLCASIREIFLPRFA